MPNSHSEKYVSNLLIGFSALIGYALITFYAIFELKKDLVYLFDRFLNNDLQMNLTMDVEKFIKLKKDNLSIKFIKMMKMNL